jgi:prepilin-type N-terminal cleavage/methylation domain-containing protein
VKNKATDYTNYADAKSVLICEICGKKSKQSFTELNLKEIKMQLTNKIGASQVKGFTLVEILITLVLTSLAVTMAFGTLSYIQKLFHGYKEQNKFLNQLSSLKQRLDYESITCNTVINLSNNSFLIKHDTTETQLDILEKVILLKKAGHCDTFNMAVKNIKISFEFMRNPVWTNKLVNSLEFETEFTKQRFNFYFYKNYDASVKLALDIEN